MMVPPVVARRGSPLAWEREIGGTGEGVNRWERLGREDERKRMCDAPESGIWGEDRDTSRDKGLFGVVGGNSRGREDHTLLPQCRTVGTVWGLVLVPCLTLFVRPGVLIPCLTLFVRPGESRGPCGEGDGSESESGRGVPSASLDPPRHRPPEECVRVSEEDLGLGLRGEGEAADKTDVPGDDRGQKKWRGLPRGVLKFKKNLDVGGVAGDSSRRALKRPPITWGIGGGACGCQRGKEESL